MPMTPKQMEKLLLKNGFQLMRSNGSHRFYEHPVTKHKTVVPFHSKDLKTGIEKEILKQTGLK